MDKYEEYTLLFDNKDDVMPYCLELITDCHCAARLEQVHLPFSSKYEGLESYDFNTYNRYEELRIGVASIIIYRNDQRGDFEVTVQTWLLPEELRDVSRSS